MCRACIFILTCFCLKEDSPPETSSETTKSDASKPDSKTVESGVVYDSATLKKSVKDKISMFRKSGNLDESEAPKGKPLSASNKEDSSSRVASHSGTKDKSQSLPRNVKPADTDKEGKKSEDKGRSEFLNMRHWSTIHKYLKSRMWYQTILTCYMK